MANDRVNHRLLDYFGKKDREILDYLSHRYYAFPCFRIMFCYSQPGANAPFGVSTIPKSLVPIASTSSTSTNMNCNSDHCATQPAWSHALPHSFFIFQPSSFPSHCIMIYQYIVNVFFFPILTLSVFNHGYHWFIFIACNMQSSIGKPQRGEKII